jgi:peptidoglycan/LPS O-acetylase OafA/YrhL
LTEKLRYLEGLRGLAAFIVYLGHFCPMFIISISFFVALLTSIFFFGRVFCVYLFFVLSGYVLTYVFFKTKNQDILISGAVRRYIRLLVPVVFLLVIVYLGFSSDPRGLLNPEALKSLILQTFWGVFIQGQVTMAFADSSYTSVLWTMTIEFIGSFIVFSFCSLFGNLRNRWIFYCIASVLFLNSCFFAFILGMALADLSWYHPSKKWEKIKNPGTVALAFFLGLFLGSYPVIPLFSVAYSSTGQYADLVLATLSFANPAFFPVSSMSTIGFIYTIGAFFILAAVINSHRLQSFCSSTVPVFLGKISFSLYLIHMVIINSLSFFLLRSVFGSDLNFYTGIGIFLITTVILLCCSYLMYRYVDLPGIALSKWVYQRFFKNE